MKDELGDLELSGASSFRNEFGANEICFICQNKPNDHDPRKRDSFAVVINDE